MQIYLEIFSLTATNIGFSVPCNVKADERGVDTWGQINLPNDFICH